VGFRLVASEGIGRAHSGRPRLRLVVPFLLVSVGVLRAPARAGELYGDPSARSKIVLVERAQEAAFRDYRVTILTLNGRTKLKGVKDGVKLRGRMPASACHELWRSLLQMGIDHMPSARPERIAKDAAEFTITLQVGDNVHRFSVYDVDSLPDPRYREAVRMLLRASRENLAPTPVARPKRRGGKR
jgi:hypothetical protein